MNATMAAWFGIGPRTTLPTRQRTRSRARARRLGAGQPGRRHPGEDPGQGDRGRAGDGVEARPVTVTLGADEVPGPGIRYQRPASACQVMASAVRRYGQGSTRATLSRGRFLTAGPVKNAGVVTSAAGTVPDGHSGSSTSRASHDRGRLSPAARLPDRLEEQGHQQPGEQRRAAPVGTDEAGEQRQVLEEGPRQRDPGCRGRPPAGSAPARARPPPPSGPAPA